MSARSRRRQVRVKAPSLALDLGKGHRGVSVADDIVLAPGLPRMGATRKDDHPQPAAAGVLDRARAVGIGHDHMVMPVAVPAGFGPRRAMSNRVTRQVASSTRVVAVQGASFGGVPQTVAHITALIEEIDDHSSAS
jgi:hypothetical protein